MGGIDADTLYGTLNLLVLRALRDGALHGLAVSRRIEAATRGAVRIEEGGPVRLSIARSVRARGGGLGASGREPAGEVLSPDTEREAAARGDAARGAHHAEAVAGLLGLSPGWTE